MSESKSIIDLCRSLPNSEPELRARADEFCLEIEKHVQVSTAWRRRDYVNNIADAKPEFRPQGSDSLSAPTGHRSFLQIPPAPSGVLE